MTYTNSLDLDFSILKDYKTAENEVEDLNAQSAIRMSMRKSVIVHQKLR
jgi:hypothetical protein